VDPGKGTGGGSSSGVSSSSGSSGVGGSSSGVSSSSSSGGPVTSPECTGLALPAIALLCADGSGAAPYYVWDGTKCVLAYDCSRTVYPPPPSSSSSSSGVGGSSSSSGGIITPPPSCDFALPNICEACSNGETVCAHYAIQNGSCTVEICPPGTIVTPGGDCSQGAVCSQGTGCGTASSGPGQCSVSCNCDYTGHFQCSQNCYIEPPPPPPPPVNYCSQGQSCMPGSGCGGGPDQNGCYVSCSCSNSYTLDCSYDCGFGAADAGAVE
jgi:hypothetical protein